MILVTAVQLLFPFVTKGLDQVVGKGKGNKYEGNKLQEREKAHTRQVATMASGPKVNQKGSNRPDYYDFLVSFVDRCPNAVTFGREQKRTDAPDGKEPQEEGNKNKPRHLTIEAHAHTHIHA